jgi:hypothetical protein
LRRIGWRSIRRPGCSVLSKIKNGNAGNGVFDGTKEGAKEGEQSKGR